MYLNHWGMRSRPFENTRDPIYYYPARSHHAALLRLRYTLEERAESAMLLGPCGIGKTFLLRCLRSLNSSREALFPFVHLVFPQLSAEETLRYCIARLHTELAQDALARDLSQRKFPKGRFTRVDPPHTGVTQGETRQCEVRPVQSATRSGAALNRSSSDFTEPSRRTPELKTENKNTQATPEFAAHSVAALLLETERMLKSNARMGRRVVFVLDDADRIENPNVFHVFKSLLEIEEQGSPCVSLLLLGENRPHETIPREPSPEQWIEERCVLDALDSEETEKYVFHRLRTSGAREDIFAPSALRLIAEQSLGIPRRINRICDLALLVGYAENKHELDEQFIATIFDELLSL